MPTASSSVSQIAPILREVDLRFEVGSHMPPVASVVRPLTYIDQWRTIINRGWYSYKLEDHSIFVFSEGGSATYSFLPCPLDVQSLRDFSKAVGVEGAAIYASENQSEYEVYLSTARMLEHVTPVRFDFAPSGFNHECHPIGHLHIGMNSSMRLGTERRWNPLAFFLFVLRQYYPDRWRVLLSKPSARALPRRVRQGLALHEDEFLKPIFTRECFLA
jgi:hypothetical protein